MPAPERSDLIAALVAAGRRLDALGLVPARDGNISARLPAGPGSGGRLLVTATGRRKRSLTEADFVEMDLDGRVQGPGRPSTEIGMHLAVYRLRPDVGAVVHAHPPVAVGFASAGQGLTECLMPEVAVSLGAVPLTPYATPGTPEIEAAIADTARSHDAFLLANHGAVTLGASVEEALDRMETLEHFARIALVTRLLGGPKPLGRADVDALQAQRRRAGDPRPVTCDPAEGPRAASPVPAGLPPDLALTVAAAVRAILGAPGPDRG
jgi:L-fuculose-phosphate aldolase